jgi:hypothetical protein
MKNLAVEISEENQGRITGKPDDWISIGRVIAEHQTNRSNPVECFSK